MADPQAINIMLLSGDYAKIHAAAMLTTVAASYGKPVRVFVSMEALPAFHRDPAISDSITRGPVARTLIQQGGDSFLELFRQSKELGEVKLYACSLVMDVYHWSLSDMADLFDDTLGVAGFLAQVEGESTYTL
jgi:peroxiredoxin family protein